MKNSRSHAIGAAIATTLSLCWSASAQPTQTEVALDLDFAQPVAEEGADSGGGGALRLGQQLDLIAITLTGEAGGSHHAFGGNEDPSLYALFAGGRISVGKIIEPGILMHVGASHLATKVHKSWAPMFDVGLTIDLTVLPLVDLGVHGIYVHRFANSEAETFEYLVVGPHVALVF